MDHDTNFYERFARTAERIGGRIAIEVQRRDRVDRFTYARLHAMADSAAAFLEAQGLGRGDRCALLADNDAHWCAVYLGVMRLGAIVVPLDTSYTATQIGKLLGDSGAKLIVASPRFATQVERAQADLGRSCPAFLLHADGAGKGAMDLDPQRPARAPGPGRDPAAGRDDPAVILYTSGTTSDPKGVLLTHGNLLGEIESALSVITITEADAILGVLPLFHALAQVANLMLPLSVGARVVFLETVATGELMRALQERKITAFCCVPQFFYLIHQRMLERVRSAGRVQRWLFRAMLSCSGFLRERLRINAGGLLFRRVHHALGRDMRLLVTGGSRFDPRIGRDLFRLGFNILQAYGLTECTGAATILRPNDRHVDSVGQALPGVEIEIRPWSENGAAVGESSDARVGEVALRGPVVFGGYYNRPDANAQAFRDGWFLTGDLGYLDPAGRLYITGRAKEIIVLGSGKNIYPEEIEAHYLQSPYIKELCVMGRTLGDLPAAERLHAVIVPDFELFRERKVLNSKEMLRWEIENLSTQLPGHKRILSYDIVTDDLPRTTTRKLKRFEIERNLEHKSLQGAATGPAAAESEQDSAWAAQPHVAGALAIIAEAAHDRAAVRPSANLELDLGLDSMERVELQAALEARFEIEIPEETAHTIHTVRELVDAVDAAGAGTAELDRPGAIDPWEHLLSAAQTENDPGVAAILDARPILAPLLFAGSKLLHLIARLLLRLRVSGRENLPREGPFLICPNHQSFFDGFLVAGALPYRVFSEAFFVGAAEYFQTPLLARFARWIHLVPVDPDTHLVRAMRAGARGLQGGKVLILFPEGERSIDDDVKTFKKGAAILSLRFAAPVVPVALDGVFDVWPRGRGLKLSKLLPFSGTRARIHFGPAIVPDGGQDRSREDYQSFTARLRQTVVDMLQALRRGV